MRTRTLADGGPRAPARAPVVPVGSTPGWRGERPGGGATSGSEGFQESHVAVHRAVETGDLRIARIDHEVLVRRVSPGAMAQPVVPRREPQRRAGEEVSL